MRRQCQLADVDIRKPPSSMTGKELKDVLRTREIKYQPTDKVSTLRVKVSNLYAHEDKTGLVTLKDPKGLSTYQHLLYARKIMSPVVPISCPDLASKSWVRTMSQIARQAPVLSLSVIRKHFVSKGQALDGHITCKAMKKAFQRMINLTVLSDFRFFPATDPSIPLSVSLAEAPSTVIDTLSSFGVLPITSNASVWIDK
jgi:hypothetical protein